MAKRQRRKARDRVGDTARMMAALSRRYQAPRYALLEQVPDGTGSVSSGRYADAVVMSLWPSDGLSVHGFELKSARGDWLKELRQPQKAEPLKRFCHFWWLVTVPEVVHDEGELPETWGWIQLKGQRLFTMKKAPRQKALDPDWPLIASFLRRASEMHVPRSAVKETVEREVEEKLERRTRLIQMDLDTAKDKLEQLRARVSTFEEASGVSLKQPWQWRRTEGDHAAALGEAVKMVMDGGLESERGAIERHRDALVEITERLTALLELATPKEDTDESAALR